MLLTIAAGDIGKDAVTRQAGQNSVTGFSLATEERRKGEKVTTWIDVSIWGKRGEALQPHLTKGSKVTVSGRLSTREHDGRTYLQIDADNVALQGGGQPRQVAANDHRYDAPPPGSQSSSGLDDDETPF